MVSTHFCLVYFTQHIYFDHLGFPGGSAVKNLPAMQKTQEMQGREDPPEKGTATHASIPAWRLAPRPGCTPGAFPAAVATTESTTGKPSPTPTRTA